MGAGRPLTSARGGGGLCSLREQRAGSAWSGAWCREEKGCKGGSVCVCKHPCAWQRLGYGNSRGWSCRPRHSAAPEANGQGLLSAPPPLAPVNARAPAHKRRERGEGEEKQSRWEAGAALLPAPPPLACPPGNELTRRWSRVPAFWRFSRAPTRLRCPGWEFPGARGLTGSRKLHLAEGRGTAKRVAQRAGNGGAVTTASAFASFFFKLCFKMLGVFNDTGEVPN